MPDPAPTPTLELHLDGYEGPLDLLLDLARAQKVDLHRISILELVEQFLRAIAAARVALDLAADWLVMAAWLAWLKSRLLLPAGTEAAEEGEVAAELLADRLQALEHVRGVAAFLAARPQLGIDSFGRGGPEILVAIDRSELAADLPSLLRAYAASRRRASAGTPYAPARPPLFTVADALERLGRLLGRRTSWTALAEFLPSALGGETERRAALASTLLAGLELAREGRALLRQDASFGPILLRPA